MRCGVRFASYGAWPALFLVLFAVSACTTLPAVKQRALAFSIHGRVSVQYGEETSSGLLDWQAYADGDEVLLSSPLGQGVAKITRGEGGVTLDRPGQEPVSAANAEQLTEATLGFQLPLSGLRYWVQAQADPARPAALDKNESGEIIAIRQDGWDIGYPQYREGKPRKITVKREGLSIRLVIDSWQSGEKQP